MIIAWLSPARDFSTHVLSGDAGCGKSFALRGLHDSIEDLGLGKLACFTATTHVAAELLPPGQHQTCHSAAGLRFELCTETNLEAFIVKYSAMYSGGLAKWDTIGETDCCDFHWEGCDTRCPDCMAKVRSRVGSYWLPPVAYASLVVVDEYGMLSELDFMKLFWVLRRFAIRGQEKFLVVSGSVVQLNGAGGEKPIWDSDFTRQIFTRNSSSTTALTTNCRQTLDTPYARALSLMQFNIISGAAEEIFNSRVVGPEKAMDPKFQREALRIFNCNQQKRQFTERHFCELYAATVDLSVMVTGRGTRSKLRALNEELRKLHPKVFIDRRGVGWGNTVLCRVGKGSQVRMSGTRSLCTLVDEVKVGKSKKIILHHHGCVEPIPLITTTVAVEGLTAEFYPLEVGPEVAINTFSAQGITLVERGLVYSPPEHYGRSPIKPSAYVAMSRVQSREFLWLARNPFRRGRFEFFPQKLLRWKYEVEMGYGDK